jgi:lipopolysaccharide cholinephosphotransferase
MTDNKERKELTQEQLRKMQLLEVGMAEEFDRVCRKHNIMYSLDGGTLIGAVRHKGFIPWDDDMDICMLREEYEKFRKVADELNPDICYFQDHENDPEYRWGFAKLRRTGTSFVRLGQEHMNYKTGIAIDIFPLDDVPKSVIGQMFLDLYCYCLRKTLWSEAGKKTSKGLKRIWFSLLSKIPSDFVFDRIKKITRKSRNTTPNRVRVLMFPSIGKIYYKRPLKTRYSIPKSWFTELDEYEFEGKKFWGTRDYDARLYHQYGDYMTLPPEDQRESHIPFSYIDFGDN